MSAQLQTERLILRELEASDYSPAYLGWLNDPVVARFLETRHHPQDRESVLAFIETVRASDREYLYGIFLAEDGRHIGNIKVGPIHPYHRLADVSLLIGARDCWGQGFASEAIAALSAHAFERLAVQKLSASMYAPNAGSRRAFLKAGYREEGVRKDHYFLDGQRCDLIELGLVPADLEGRQ